MLAGVSGHTEQILGAGYCGSRSALAGDGQGHNAALGSALWHGRGHGLAEVTPFSPCMCLLWEDTSCRSGWEGCA